MAGTNIATTAGTETGLAFMAPYIHLPLDVQNNILTMAVQSLQKERDDLQLSNTQLTLSNTQLNVSNTQLTVSNTQLTADLVYERGRSVRLFNNTQYMAAERQHMIETMQTGPYGRVQPVTPP